VEKKKKKKNPLKANPRFMAQAQHSLQGTPIDLIILEPAIPTRTSPNPK